MYCYILQKPIYTYTQISLTYECFEDKQYNYGNEF